MDGIQLHSPVSRCNDTFTKMKRRFISYNSILSWIAILLIGTPLTSCVDDKLLVDEPGTNGEDSTMGEVLKFDFTLDIDPYTRDGDSWSVGMAGSNPQVEDFDDYIDTQDKFRVFFFTEQGDFLFGAIDRTISRGVSNSVNTAVYTVRIPMNVIIDRQGNEYPIGRIKDYLKTHNFKVAVLANWPNAGKTINSGDYDDGDSSEDSEDNFTSTLKGHPQWNFRNSVLYEGADKDVKNINDLHHLFDESFIYASTETNSTRASNMECYQPFMAKNDDGKWAMGEPTDWVKMRDIDEKSWKAGYPIKYISSFHSKETANQWIRANWTPDKDKNNNKAIYRHYQHLWYLWNFDASYKYSLFKSDPNNNINYALAYQANLGWNDGLTQGVANTWGEEWYKRNGQEISGKMKGTSSNKPMEGFTIVSSVKGQNDSFFTFNAFENNEGCYMVTNPASGYNGNVTYFGIRLPSRGNELAGNESPGVFVFQARTAGTLRVKWGNGHNGQEAKLCIQKGKEWQREYTISTNNRYRLFDLGGTSHPGETFYDIAMEGESAPVYIYCSQGDAVIYGIEYIRGKYLYETDREGVAPDADQPIPMYGVQNFSPLTDWTEGSTIDLTTGANGKSISLLRALAKIEVYIPESLDEQPRHMYMRNMNRSARCEPMNVQDPVEWPELDEPSGHSSNCEFFKIMNHGAFFNKDKGKESQEYRDWLSWFYGSWNYASWYVDGYDDKLEPLGNITGFSFQSTDNLVKNYTSSKTYTGDDNCPNIFNPYINRSDFCHFIYKGTEGSYHKYVLYMPEKYIDDPKHPGVFNSDPMVPHIEYRFSPGVSVDDKADHLTHSEFNLDDDRCFRIYFTNYGTEDNLGTPNPYIKGVAGSSYGTYEKNTNHLNYHWPIMRNHTYQFFVNGSAPDRLTVSVKITDWKHEKVVAVW